MTMTQALTSQSLQKRWENALSASDQAASRHPQAYRELKALIRTILSEPLDIGDYFPTADRLVDLLKTLDPVGKGTIFHLFRECLEPTSVWHVKLLRVECRNLLEHLDEFDAWRVETHRLRVIK